MSHIPPYSPDAPASPIPAVNANDDPHSIKNVALAYLKEAGGVKNLVLKPIHYVAEAVALHNPSRTGAKELSVLAKDSKNLLGIAGLPRKGSEVLEKGSKFTENPDLGTFGDFLSKISDYFVDTVDAIKTITPRIAPLYSSTLSVLSNTASAATVYGTSYDTYQQVQKAQGAREMATKDKTKEALSEAQGKNSMLASVRNISFCALGSLSLSAAFFSVAAPAWILWAIGVNGLAFTVFADLHKKQHPELEANSRPAPIRV